MSRTSHLGLPIACLTLALLWATSPPEAGASLVQLTGDPDPSGALTFGPLGQLSGFTLVNTISVVPPDAGPAFAITNGQLSFNLGGPAGGSAASGFNFSFGGSIVLTGSFDGGPMETILSVTGRLDGGFLSNVGGSPGAFEYRFFRGEILFIGELAADVAAAYRSPRWVVGSFGVDFTGAPGGASATGATGFVRFEAAAASTPEPGSAALVGAGLAGVIGWRVRKGRGG